MAGGRRIHPRHRGLQQIPLVTGVAAHGDSTLVVAGQSVLPSIDLATIRALAGSALAVAMLCAPTDVLAGDGIEAYRLEGSLFFAATPRIFQNLTISRDTQVVVLRLAGLHTLDASGAAHLAELVGQLRGGGLTVLLKGVDDRHLRTLSAVGVLDAPAVTPSSVDPAGHSHLLHDMDLAMTHARAHLVPRDRYPAAGVDLRAR